MQDPATALQEWRKELKRLGFRGLGTGGRRGTYQGREVGPLQQAIGVLVAEHRDGAVNVQLNINMPLRCAEPPHHVVILDGDLGAGRVRILEPWEHEPGTNTWWPAEEIDSAWEALRAHGLAWLDRYSDLAALIDLFEESFAHHELQGRRGQPESWLSSIRRRLGLTQPFKRTGHQEYLLWLAMLYEEVGDMAAARERLASYAEAMESRGIVADRARLERHRQALGGGG